MFGINEYEWSDTAETIAEYYARHSKNATSTHRFLTSKRFMTLVISMIAMSAAIGAYRLLADSIVLARVFGVIGGLIVGGFVGMMIFVEQFDRPISRKVCGVADTRMLR